MSRDRIEALWGRRMAGEGLSPGEEGEILDALRADPALRAELLRDLQLDGVLREWEPRREEEEEALGEFVDRLDVEADASRFIAKVDARLVERPRRRLGASRRRPDRRPSTALAWALAAASALVIGLLSFAFSRPAPLPPERAPEAVVPRRVPEPEPRVQPTPPPPPPPVAPTPESRAPERVPAPMPAAPPEPGPPPAPSAPPPPPPTQPAPAPAPLPKPETRTAVAVVRSVRGEAFILGPEGRAAAAAGLPLLEEGGLETAVGAAVEVAFPDETRFRLEGAAGGIRSAPAKRLSLERGSLEAVVGRQPAGRPFVVRTPHAEVSVLGTTLRLRVSDAATRLEVEEGQVRLRRLADGKAVDVAAGQFAVAAPGSELAAHPFPLDEIVLLARDGRATGGEWAAVRDAETSSGVALESTRTGYRVRRVPGGFEYEPLASRPAFVTFRFVAEAERDYHVWIRARSLASSDRLSHDEVGLDVPGARLSRRCAYLGAGSETSYAFKGFGNHPGYAWIGGNAEGGKDEPPLVLRFARPGPQILKLYAIEAPVRVECLWLSTTQKTRPRADQGPAR